MCGEGICTGRVLGARRGVGVATCTDWTSVSVTNETVERNHLLLVISSSCTEADSGDLLSSGVAGFHTLHL